MPDYGSRVSYRAGSARAGVGGGSRSGGGVVGGGARPAPARGNNTLDFMGDRLIGAGGFSTLPGSGGIGSSSSRMPSVIGASLSGAGGWNPAVQGSGVAAAAGAGGGGSTNYAAADPRAAEMANLWRQRLTELRDPNYTALAKSRAQGDIMDRAAGARDVATTNAARQMRLGSGGQAAAHTGIDEAAKRLAARAGTDIDLGHQSTVNSFLLGGQGIMEAPARLALAQQGLGLQQRGQDLSEREAVAGRDDARLATLLGLMRNPPPSYAYAGGY